MNWLRRLLRRDGAKDIEPWRGGAASTENGNNFVTNQVTLADYQDGRFGNPGAAVGLSATWACVQLIAGTIASLPLMVYRTGEDGIRRVAKDHPLYFVLHDSPNFDQTAVDFWEVMAASIELYGNAYALIGRRSSDGALTSLYPIRPDLVKVRRKESGALEYEWTDNGRRTVRSGDDVLHIRGSLGDALGGASTLSMCRSVSGFTGVVRSTRFQGIFIESVQDLPASDAGDVTQLYRISIDIMIHHTPAQEH